MSALPGAPHKYALPKPGALFQKEEQDGQWQFGQIIGVKETRVKKALDPKEPEKLTEVTAAWVAHLSTGFREFRFEIAHDKTYSSTNEWHPVPAEKVDEVRAKLAEKLEEAFAQLGHLEIRVATLEDASGAALDKALARITALEGAANSAPTGAPTNGKSERPSRTAATG